MHLSCRLGDHNSKGTILYLYSLSQYPLNQRYMWGYVQNAPGIDLIRDRHLCLERGRERVRAALPRSSRIRIADGWEVVEAVRCLLPHTWTIGVYDHAINPPEMKEGVWITYTGPGSSGTARASGPWG